MVAPKPALELQRGYKSKSWLGFVAQYPCWACESLGEEQISRTEVHHQAGIGGGMKASDLLTFGLCNEHHNDFDGKVGVVIHKGKVIQEDLSFCGIIVKLHAVILANRGWLYSKK